MDGGQAQCLQRSLHGDCAGVETIGKPSCFRISAAAEKYFGLDRDRGSKIAPGNELNVPAVSRSEAVANDTDGDNK
jgi:hypothetical protein